MDVQNTFYILGIIYMILGILILIGIGVVVIILFKLILDLKKKVNERVRQVQNVLDHPEDYAADFAVSVMKAAFRSAKKVFSQKKNEAREEI